MSPEQARGEKVVDKRDRRLRAGRDPVRAPLRQKMPHPGDSHNAILHHIATQPAVPLDSLRADLPAELLAIVGRALTSDPAARPASAGALAQALAPFARREAWPTAPEASGPNVAALASTSVAVPGAAGPAARGVESKGTTFNDCRGTPAPSPRRASRAARVALGSAVLVAAAIAIGMGIGMQPKSIPPGSEARSASPLPVDPGPPKVVETPPLKVEEKPTAPAPAAAGVTKLAAATAGSGAAADRGRPAGRPGGRPARRPSARRRQPPPPPPRPGRRRPRRIPTSVPPTFDPANPYR